MHQKRAWRILGDLRKVSELRLRTGRGETNLCATGAHVIWGRWKSQVYLSLCQKTFKLKDNKKFRTWTKKSYVFFVFQDSYVIYEHFMNIICTFHIFMYGYVTYVWGWGIR